VKLKRRKMYAMCGYSERELSLSFKNSIFLVAEGIIIVRLRELKKILLSEKTRRAEILYQLTRRKFEPKWKIMKNVNERLYKRFFRLSTRSEYRDFFLEVRSALFRRRREKRTEEKK